MELSNFDDICPYADHEVSAALKRLCTDPLFREVTKSLPMINLGEIEKKADSYHSVLDFQLEWERPFLEWLAKMNSTGLTSTGNENVTGHGELYLTNHRDITVDPAFVNLCLVRAHGTTCEIAIGDNLYAQPWIKEFVRLSRSFTVRRNLTRGEMIKSFAHMSEYIRFTITQQGHSLWMAQREGRSKDSSDHTQESLLKMLSLSGESTFIENLKSLNIHPTTLSYEYDPCDYLKAVELQLRRDNPDFHKGANDDVISMKTGILGSHGRINVHYGESINPQLDALAALGLNRKEQTEAVCQLIDRQIHSHYLIYPINEWAYSVLQGKPNGDKTSEAYLRAQMQKVAIPSADHDFLWHKMVEMYANPYINKLNNK